MQPKVSIIIPIFNAEATLHSTLESVGSEITNADFQVEVIAVDDGSTDKSIALLEDFSKLIPIRIFKLDHTGSPAQPRNLGIENAHGEYLFFLDSDDVLLPGGLAAAVQLAQDCKSDLVVCRLKSIDGRGVPRGMFKGNQGDVKLANSRIYWALNPMKLIRREVIMAHNIRFDTNLRRDEDQPFALKSYLAANKISVLSEPAVVGVRYSPSGTNLTLREYLPSDLFDYLTTMTKLLDQSISDEAVKQFLLIRNWEIEISREMIWNRLALLPKEQWEPTFNWLHEFSKNRLVPNMLPKISIRWRGVVSIIGLNDYTIFARLLNERRAVLENRTMFRRISGKLCSNLVRLKATIFLPKSFN